MHRWGRFPGYSIIQHTAEITALVKKTDARTLLDYGSGEGKQYTEKHVHRSWGGVCPSCFDPYVDWFSEKPAGLFDGVICTDVLEHVPEEDIPALLADIFSSARLFVFLSICTREAKKTLPDGRNCHLTVKPRAWWMKAIGARDVDYEIAWTD